MSRTRWLQLALAVSVALNLLVLGAVVGRVMNPAPPLQWAVQPLDAGTRAALRPLLRERLASAKPLRRDLRRSHERLRRLLAEPVLNESSVREQMARIRELGGLYQQQMHELSIDLMRDLSPEQRLQVFGRIMARRRGSPPPRNR